MGSLVISAAYEPFATIYGSSGSEAFKFTGEKHDDPTGLVHLRARQYDPALGRFLGADAILGKQDDPQTHNRYAYVAGNPLRYTDPSGQFLNIVIGAVAGAAIGGAVCAWQHGGWSNDCLVSIGVGAVAGAVAGATFNPALGMFTGTAMAGTLTATVSAGAISGALAGAASYATEGAITHAMGGQFEWSAEGFALSVGFGAATGAAFAGIGHGVGKYAPKLFKIQGQQVKPGQDPAAFWTRGTFKTPQDSLAYHVGKHGLGRNLAQYTDDALATRDALWGVSGVRQGLVPIGGIRGHGKLVQQMTGFVGWKIWGQQGGIYTFAGRTVTFWG